MGSDADTSPFRAWNVAYAVSVVSRFSDADAPSSWRAHCCIRGRHVSRMW